MIKLANTISGILIIGFIFMGNTSFAQKEKDIVTPALQNYTKDLPKLELRAFQELRKLQRPGFKPKHNEFKNYQFIILPMYKLTKDFTHYKQGEPFSKYIDFGKRFDDYTAFVFNDSVYTGALHFSNYDNSIFSALDTNKYNKSVFIDNFKLSQQIKNFKADLILYPQCPMYICFIKDGLLYMGTSPKQMQPLECILPMNEFIIKYPAFINELKENKHQ